MDFPHNDGEWSGEGRTKAHWLKDTLAMPFAHATFKDGGTEVTAKHQNGFLRVETEQADTDCFMALTRDTLAVDEIRATRKIGTKWASGERAYWAQIASIAEPLHEDRVAQRYRSGLYSMGGNGAVFCVVPVSRESVTDRWGREVTYEVPPVLGGGTRTYSEPSVRRNMAIFIGSPNGGFVQNGPTFPVDSFSESIVNRGVYSGLGAFSRGDYIEGIDAESPAPPAVVEGARYQGSYEAAVAFNTLDDAGDRVVRVRVFRTDGAYIERTIAGAPKEAFSLRGFWRCGPGEYLACISHMYQTSYGKGSNPQAAFGVGTAEWAGYAPMYTFIDQVLLPAADLPMNFFVASSDGGRTWAALPENDLLSGANAAALDASTFVEYGSCNPNDTRDVRNVMSYAIHNASAVPVAPGKMFVTLVDSYSVPASSRGDYRNTRVIRGVLDVRTGVVTSFAVVRDMPALDDVGFTAWRAIELGYTFGGACLVPSGVAYITMPDATSSADQLNSFPRLHRSSDSGVSFVADAQSMPGRWYVSRAPQVLSDGFYQVDLNTAPTYSSVYKAAGATWKLVATQTAPWRGYPYGATAPVASSAYNYIVDGLITNFNQLYNRLVQPYKSPTPSARWVSDDRITP